MHPIAPALFVGVDSVEVAELLGAGCSGDALPLVIAVGRVAFLLGGDRRDDRGVVGQGRSLIDRLGPGDITFVAVDAVGVGLGDTGVRVGFRLVSDPKLGRLHAVADDMFVDGLSAQREVLFELVRRHEEGRPHRVERAGSAIGRELVDGHVHSEQVAEGVLVLASVQATHRDLPMGVADRLTGGHQRARKHLEEIGFGDRGRLFGVIGRHLA